MAHPEHGACPGRGRPRDPEIDTAILKATQRQLAAYGYERMSVEAIATEAGVTKPTIYRRWPSKADLATAALAAMQAQEPPPVTGCTRADVTAHLNHFRRSIERPLGMSMIGSLLVEEQYLPKLMDLFRQRVVQPRRRMLRLVLEEAQARGEIRPTADLDLVISTLLGAFYAQYLTGGSLPKDWAERVVDTLWDGIASAASAGERRPRKLVGPGGLAGTEH